MTFTHAIFLLFLFPAAFFADQLLPGTKARNWFLVLVGLVFYAFGQLKGIPALLLSAVVNYAAGFFMMSRPRGRKTALILTVLVDLLFLCGLKYLDLFVAGVGVVPPMGISFFTLKGVAYVVDAYRDESKASRSFLEVLLYLSFFPQVTAGPISRFDHFRAQLTDRPRDPESVARGLRRFIVGFAKKLLIAAPVSAVADAAFCGTPDVRLAWLGAAAYTVQIYFDFSGYSDMAIGLAAVFGFRTPENFNYPYMAASITDFWRRWHISLSLWFRDYLYIPLGGNRGGRFRTGVNKAIVFLLCGLWHGTNWTFLLWGVWHGLFALLESSTPLDIRRLDKTRVGRALGHIYTLLVVCLGFVIFRAPSPAGALQMFQALFTGFTPIPAATLALERIQPVSWLALAVGTAACTPLGIQIFARAEKKLGETGVACVSYLLATGLFVLCLLAAAGSGQQPFVYAQF